MSRQARATEMDGDDLDGIWRLIRQLGEIGAAPTEGVTSASK
jgi:hypothetical protein